MNVKELRTILAAFPDNAEVVTTAQDHEYQPLRETSFTTALRSRRGVYTEDFHPLGKVGEVTDYGVRVPIASLEFA